MISNLAAGNGDLRSAAGALLRKGCLASRQPKGAISVVHGSAVLVKARMGTDKDKTSIKKSACAPGPTDREGCPGQRTHDLSNDLGVLLRTKGCFCVGPGAQHVIENKCTCFYKPIILLKLKELSMGYASLRGVIALAAAGCNTSHGGRYDEGDNSAAGCTSLSRPRSSTI